MRKKNPDFPPTPRYSWGYYGISKERYKQLTEYIKSEKYGLIATEAAYTIDRIIGKYILLSIIENKSYDDLKKESELKKIERVPCGRTDFYGMRRKFYHIMDKKMKAIKK